MYLSFSFLKNFILGVPNELELLRDSVCSSLKDGEISLLDSRFYYIFLKLLFNLEKKFFKKSCELLVWKQLTNRDIIGLMKLNELIDG